MAQKHCMHGAHVFTRNHMGRHECACIQGGPLNAYMPSWVPMYTYTCTRGPLCIKSRECGRNLVEKKVEFVSRRS